ncbi:hypothetical protein [Streptomyces sp. KN37]|uniref:hypothetical protein n=1 Tax=Streptomyces sp. KN37 TaxID=3090667 RepID=UPI002A748CD0|nr:hypothetical protein [Streptomyces sp. KN37]WPO76286.1 hypothetical protein R9806_37040 [Streptomyces sp. KN37]
MTLPYFEVDVPIHHDSGLTGVHIFTGPADSRSTAVRIAHEVYDAARAAAEAGLEIDHGRPDGWGACGYRPGWEPEWNAAVVGRWNDPYSWTRACEGDFEL